MVSVKFKFLKENELSLIPYGLATTSEYGGQSTQKVTLNS
jgi:hypothetical protein